MGMPSDEGIVRKHPERVEVLGFASRQNADGSPPTPVAVIRSTLGTQFATEDQLANVSRMGPKDQRTYLATLEELQYKIINQHDFGAPLKSANEFKTPPELTESEHMLNSYNEQRQLQQRLVEMRGP